MGRGRGEENIREVADLSLGCIPHLNRLGRVLDADELLEVGGQGFGVPLEGVVGRGRGGDALGDVDYDGGEAVFVDVDFLVVGDLAELGDVGEVGGEVDCEGAAEEGGWLEGVAGHFGEGTLSGSVEDAVGW